MDFSGIIANQMPVNEKAILIRMAFGDIIL